MNKSVTYDDLFQACVYLDTNISERVEYEEDRQRLKHIADILEYVSKEIVNHGHWLDMGKGFVSCSECGEMFFGNVQDAKRIGIYCNHCGSKMDEEV